MKRVYDKGHDDYRKVCCFFCLRKGEGKKTDAPLSARETELIVSHFFPNFEMEKDFLPLGCCGSCRANLSYRFGKTQRLERYKPFPCESDNSFYQDIIDSIRKLPRGSGGNKNCQWKKCVPYPTSMLKSYHFKMPGGLIPMGQVFTLETHISKSIT